MRVQFLRSFALNANKTLLYGAIFQWKFLFCANILLAISLIQKMSSHYSITNTSRIKTRSFALFFAFAFDQTSVAKIFLSNDCRLELISGYIEEKLVVIRRQHQTLGRVLHRYRRLRAFIKLESDQKLSKCNFCRHQCEP